MTGFPLTFDSKWWVTTSLSPVYNFSPCLWRTMVYAFRYNSSKLKPELFFFCISCMAFFNRAHMLSTYFSSIVIYNGIESFQFRQHVTPQIQFWMWCPREVHLVYKTGCFSFLLIGTHKFCQISKLVMKENGEEMTSMTMWCFFICDFRIVFGAWWKGERKAVTIFEVRETRGSYLLVGFGKVRILCFRNWMT